MKYSQEWLSYYLLKGSGGAVLDMVKTANKEGCPMNTASKENRKHPRINIHNHALIGYRGVFVPGVAINMSPTGLLVRLQQPPKVLPVEINVYLSNNQNKTVCLPAQVAHISGSSVGLQFLEEDMQNMPLYSIIRPVY
jgi:hypothetical protein